jgi:hypothetical protein
MEVRASQALSSCFTAEPHQPLGLGTLCVVYFDYKVYTHIQCPSKRLVSWGLGPQLVVLSGEVLETLGGGT